MARYANNYRKENPTVIGSNERLPDFSLLFRAKLTKKQPDKEYTNGKKKQYLYYRADILFQVAAKFYYSGQGKQWTA
jgi:hypothetical protein